MSIEKQIKSITKQLDIILILTCVALSVNESSVFIAMLGRLCLFLSVYTLAGQKLLAKERNGEHIGLKTTIQVSLVILTTIALTAMLVEYLGLISISITTSIQYVCLMLLFIIYLVQLARKWKYEKAKKVQ